MVEVEQQTKVMQEVMVRHQPTQVVAEAVQAPQVQTEVVAAQLAPKEKVAMDFNIR